MKKKFRTRIAKFFKFTVFDTNVPDVHPIGLDVREEYANAFRTESYNEFWALVMAIPHGDSTPYKTIESSTAARLSSYRIFVEHLLDPDQATVTQILAMTRNPTPTNTYLTEYFSTTASASILCGSLLKDIDHTRVKYRSLKATLRSFEIDQFSPKKHFSIILTRLTEFTKSPNPFQVAAPSSSRVRMIQGDCANLLKQLESSRDEFKAKLQLKGRLKHGSALIAVTLTASLTVIIATHALALLVAGPSITTAWFQLASSSRKLAKASGELDTAAKGTYILSRDLETISRLVARLNDELEDMQTMVKFWVERGEEWLEANGEVVRQLKKNDCSFNQQLDELEEHLYLCFMTINRARSLVVKQILDPGQPPTMAPNFFSN